MASLSNVEKIIRKRKFKIIALNVNSIVSHSRRINLLEILKEHTPLCMLLNETKLNKNHVLSFKDYIIERNDRDSEHSAGGTAILIKKNLKYGRIRLEKRINFTTIEQTTIRVKLSNGENLYIISIYARRRSGSEDNFIPELNSIFAALDLSSPGNYFIMAGDFNAKHTDWKNPTSNHRGEQLRKWLQDEGVMNKVKLLLAAEPTFDRGNSYLDIALIDERLQNHKEFMDTIPYASDHKAVKLKISKTSDDFLEFTARENQCKFNYRKVNWDSFKKKLLTNYQAYKENNNLEVNTPLVPNNINIENDKLDEYLETLEKLTQKTIEEQVPKYEEYNGSECYVNARVKRLQKHKSSILTKIKKINRFIHLNPFYNNDDLQRNLSELKAELKGTRLLIKQNVELNVNEYWKKKIENIRKEDSSRMFPDVNRIFRKKQATVVKDLKISETLCREIRTIDVESVGRDQDQNCIISEKSDKLEVLGTIFEQIHERTQHFPPTRLQEIVERQVTAIREEMGRETRDGIKITQFCDENRADKPNLIEEKKLFIGFKSLREIFRNTNRKKSSGLDGIPNVVLKHLPDEIIREYCVLFNNLINNMHFPESWKTSKTIPIQKPKKDSSNPCNYRPISLLPNISKIYEKIINNSILEFCEEKELITENQFGFRKQHCTTHAINKLVSDTQWEFQNNRVTGACLIDLEKAFDTVWLDGLVYKLHKLKFPKFLLKIICTMIYDRKFVVSDADSTSETKFKVSNGLQQGTINSPLLFSLFISSLLKVEKLNSAGNNIIAFADDILIYTSQNKIEKINQQLQEMFDFVQQYASNWKISINAGKCETILFRRSLHKETWNIKKNWKKFGIKMDGTVIKTVSTVNYLGVQLDYLLKFNDHVNIQLIKTKGAFQKLKRMFFTKYLNKDVKVLAYISLIRPILLYACPIWFNISPLYMEKLRIFERKCLRICLNKFLRVNAYSKKNVSNKVVYGEADIHRIDAQIIRQIRNYIQRSSENRTNSLIFGPYYPHDEYFKTCILKGNVPPEAFVYLDKEGYILDSSGIPIIYHIHRKTSDKTFLHNKNNFTEENLRFNTDMPDRDIESFSKSWKNYWWLK